MKVANESKAMIHQNIYIVKICSQIVGHCSSECAIVKCHVREQATLKFLISLSNKTVKSPCTAILQLDVGFILSYANTNVFGCIGYTSIALRRGICDWLSETF